MSIQEEREAPPLMFDLKPGERILVIGGYGVRNVGDEAILSGLLQQLPQSARVSVVSRDPAGTASMHGVRAVSPAGAITALLRSDTILVGGGGLFSSDTGPFGRHIPRLCRLALSMGKRVAFHGVGVYASASPKLVAEIKKIGPRLSSFTVRDTISVETLAAAGIRATLIDDLSRSMPAVRDSSGSQLFHQMGLDSRRPAIGLALTAINRELEAFLLAAIPEVIEALPETQFCFIPMSQHRTNERHDDSNLARALQARAPRLKILDGWHHPSKVLTLFGQLDGVVCSRYHSFLFADRCEVPIVALPYSEKCYSWLRDHQVTPVERAAEALQDALREVLAVRGAMAGTA